MKIQRRFVFLSLFFIFLISTFSSSAFSFSDKIYKELETFTRIIEILDEQYVESFDESKLIDGAIQGMLTSLDPHTVYLSPDIYRDFREDTVGKYGGVGIEITVKDGVLTVVSPLEGTPAFRAGIRSGDRILKIDGKPTKEMSLMDAVHQMRGSKGKKLDLLIWREGFSEPKEFSLVRETIQVESVKQEILDKDYVYIRIASFQENTTDTLKKDLMQLKSEKDPKGIILDLRNNPGGLLSEAIRVADLFLSEGVIVSTKGRKHKLEVSEARKNSPFEKTPLVLLINGGSASASEIVAGAFQDSKRAKILGLPSFGKGSVQTIVDLGNGSALKITIAKYYTPKGKSIEGRGIKPDIILDQKEYTQAKKQKKNENFPDFSQFQVNQALEYLKRF